MTRVFAFIDETGDRGNWEKASPIFGMAAVLVDDIGMKEIQDAVRLLRQAFDVPDGKLISWKDHLGTNEKRKYATQVLSKVSGTKVVYVYCQKSAVTGSYLDDRTLLYNFVALKLYKGVLWAARNWKGRDVKVWTRFGHVKDHDHRTTQDYFKSQQRFLSNVPFHLEQGLRWVGAGEYLESQAADLFAGFLKAAVWPDRFGNVEGSYLRQSRPFRHVVWMVSGTLVGRHQFPDSDVTTPVSERRAGLHHVAFGVADRSELEFWENRLDQLGVSHDTIKDAGYGSGLSFRDPDGLPLEFFAPPA